MSIVAAVVSQYLALHIKLLLLLLQCFLFYAFNISIAVLIKINVLLNSHKYVIRMKLLQRPVKT